MCAVAVWACRTKEMADYFAARFARCEVMLVHVMELAVKVERTCEVPLGKHSTWDLRRLHPPSFHNWTTSSLVTLGLSPLFTYH